MVSLLNFLIIGLAIGSVYGLLASSMGFVWQSTKVLDLAIGGYAAIAGMVTAAVGLPWGPLVGLAAAVAASLIMCLIYLALQKRGIADQISVAFASIGVLFASTSFALWYFGVEPRFVELLTGTWSFGGINIGRQQTFNFTVAIVLLLVLLWVVYKTPLGEILRATAASPRNAQLIGIPIRRVQLSVFLVSGLLSGGAGVLMVFTRGMSHELGLTLTIAAFGAMIVFGVRGLVSALLGGLVIGIVETFGAGFFPTSVATMVPVVFILVVLMAGRFKLEEGVRP